ncbi:ribosome maturation factor RimM [Latilactobacillus fragifolii]|uniref:ribosome maturation factor RimM n=1 Tax=Latilactobacillus fragifolii TaxID=2814244 RepID=UPI001ABBC5F9|nr:ribosome maturation factor RimM [Latilactobacillus fragifolii]
MPEKYYQVGKIVNTHGIRGEVRVIATTDFTESRFKKGVQLAVEMPNGLIDVKVAAMRQHKQFYLLQFEGMGNINDVEQFKGHNLKIAASQREDDLEEDEFYYGDIIGLEVIEEVDGTRYGKVSEIIDPGPNDVWVIKRRGRSDLLLPFLKTIVKKIDIEAGKAYVEVPEGLIDNED